MLLSTLNPVMCRIPPRIRESGSHPTASKLTSVNKPALPAVKVQIKPMKERELPLLQESSAVSSRREMMHLTAISLCFASLFFPATAEPRPRNATMRQKITDKLNEIKKKAGLPNPKDKLDELNQRTGLPNPKDKLDELKEKAGLPNPKDKLDELKQKAGLSGSKDEGKGNEPKDYEANKSKPTNETYGSKAKSKDDVAGTNPEASTQQNPAQAHEKERSLPTLPNLPSLSFLTGRTVETSVS